MRSKIWNLFGGEIYYQNRFFNLIIQRSTGLITHIYTENESYNFVYENLGFPLNEYYDNDCKCYYWPSYAISRTSVIKSPHGMAVKTTGHTRDYFFRRGALVFEQKIILFNSLPYFSVETKRKFIREVNCLDESLCFMFKGNLGENMVLINGDKKVKKKTYEGTFFLSNPTGGVVAHLFGELRGVMVFVETLNPPAEQVRWTLWPKTRKPEYCEFEIVWTNEAKKKNIETEYVKTYVFPYQNQERNGDYLLNGLSNSYEALLWVAKNYMRIS